MGAGPRASWEQEGNIFLGNFTGVGESCLGQLLATNGLRIVFSCGSCQIQVYLFDPFMP